MADSKRVTFDVSEFLSTMGTGRSLVKIKRNESIYSQGASCSSLFYIISGKIRLSIVSPRGKEATVAILSAKDFFGESSLSGQPTRLESARSLVDAELLKIETNVMVQKLQEHESFSALFASHLLSRNARLQEDLADQLLNSSEMRLARILLALADYGGMDRSKAVIPKISQEVLAEMVGTTRSRVSFFMNRFRRMGFIQYDGTIAVNSSLSSVLRGNAMDRMEMQRGEHPRAMAAR